MSSQVIGIIGFNDLHLMQYLYKYTEVLDCNNIKYEVVFWNRSGIREGEKRFRGGMRYFDVRMDTYQPFWKKMRGFLRYAAYLYKTIVQQKYDKLIILTTQGAIPLSALLLGKYNHNYIYDYRDVTKERKFGAYRALVRKLINGSYCTMMSSMGFLKTIGIEKNERIIQAHNTQAIIQSNIHTSRPENDKKPIRITFWGMVRQVPFNKKLCDVFGNDERFLLTFHGAGETETLRKYCETQEYQNIRFSGRYTTEEIAEFAKNTDIVHCLYENDEQMTEALQVKIYDAMKFRLPLIVSEGSFASSYLKPYGVAFDVDLSELPKAKDRIYEWYMRLDFDMMKNYYTMFEKKIFQDDEIFTKVLLTFVNGEKIE